MSGWLQDEIGLCGGFTYRLPLCGQRTKGPDISECIYQHVLEAGERRQKQKRTEGVRRGGGGTSDCGGRRCERGRTGRERCAESREQVREAGIGRQSDSSDKEEETPMK